MRKAIPNIKTKFLNITPPHKWDTDRSHPIHKYGMYIFGIGDSFRFNMEAIENGDECEMSQLFREAKTYWFREGIKDLKYLFPKYYYRIKNKLKLYLTKFPK